MPAVSRIDVNPSMRQESPAGLARSMGAMARRALALAAGGLLSLTLASAAHAGMVTWTLNGVAFEDGGTASGWFQWDATAWNPTQEAYNPWYTGGDYGDYEIQTSTGAGLGWNYSASDGNNIGYFTNLWGITGLAWAGYALDTPYIDLMFATPLPDSGGTVSMVGGWECSDVNNTICREIVAGTVSASVASSVPEPMSLALVAVSLAGLGVVRRRSRVSRLGR